MTRQMTLAAVLGVLCGGAILNAAEIKELRSEYRTNPLGIDIRSPRLSWASSPTAAAKSRRRIRCSWRQA